MRKGRKAGPKILWEVGARQQNACGMGESTLLILTHRPQVEDAISQAEKVFKKGTYFGPIRSVKKIGDIDN